MKHINHLISALVAAGSAGVALLTISGHLPSAFGFATLNAIGLLGFVLFDYARPVQKLRTPLAPVIRPALPIATQAARRRVPAIVERAA